MPPSAPAAGPDRPRRGPPTSRSRRDRRHWVDGSATAAICLGVLVPLFIPGLHTGIDKHGSGGSGTAVGGGGNKIVLNPIVSVASDLTSSKVVPVLRYRSTSAASGLPATDLAGHVQRQHVLLGAPAGTAERRSEREPARRLPRAAGGHHLGQRLAEPRAALAAGAGDRRRASAWATTGATTRATSTIFSATTTTESLHYTTRSVTANPAPSQLKAVPRPEPGFARRRPHPALEHPAVGDEADPLDHREQPTSPYRPHWTSSRSSPTEAGSPTTRTSRRTTAPTRSPTSCCTPGAGSASSSLPRWR